MLNIIIMYTYASELKNKKVEKFISISSEREDSTYGSRTIVVLYMYVSSTLNAAVADWPLGASVLQRRVLRTVSSIEAAGGVCDGQSLEERQKPNGSRTQCCRCDRRAEGSGQGT